MLPTVADSVKLDQAAGQLSPTRGRPELKVTITLTLNSVVVGSAVDPELYRRSFGVRRPNRRDCCAKSPSG